MGIIEPLKHRSLAFLWGGQVFSAIGDELYSVALVWLSASLIGERAGYIVAMQAASILLFSLFGGIWADRWDHRRTMIAVDIVRGIAVLLVPTAAAFGHLSVWTLILVTVLVSSPRAFFEPALKTSLPRLARTKELLQTTNALMETTSRVAKILGPGLIGVLSNLVPLVHYFTIDAITFFISAWSISGLKRDLPYEAHPAGSNEWNGVKEALIGGYHLSRSRPLIHFIILTDAVVTAAWLFIFPFAIGLLLHERMPDQVSALGLLVGAYGVGNLLSNIVLGNMKIHRFDRCLFWGKIVAGTGFCLLTFAPSLTVMMLAASFAAIAGPMADLAKLTLLQQEFTGREMARVYRFNMVAIYSALLVSLLVSPKLIALTSVSTTIFGAALVMVGFGVAGLLWAGRLRTQISL